MANAPITPLQIIQVGLEATRGTLVAATTILDVTPGSAKLTRDPHIIRVRNAGSLATSHRSYAGQDEIGIEWSGPVTYNWLTWLGNLFLGPLATGTGAGANKTWTFDNTVISDTSDNLKTATFEVAGRDAWPQEFIVSGCIADKLDISIKQDQGWSYKASVYATAIASNAKTAGLSHASNLTDVLGPDTKVYFDQAGAFGTTQQTGRVISADITVNPGTARRFTLDGTRNPFRVAVNKNREVSAKIVVEYNAQTDYTAAHAATAERIQITSTGRALGAGNWLATLKIPGTFDAFVINDDNGIITSELTLTGQYDALVGMAADIGMVVVNDKATLP